MRNPAAIAKRIFLVASTRRDFTKVAPLYKRLVSAGPFDVRIVHARQRDDREMSDAFFDQLALPAPHSSLGAGHGSHGALIERAITRFAAAVIEDRPDAIVAVGDADSTLACALAGAKIVYPDGSRPLLAHVDAGLRSRDRSMPEEISRVLTDAVSDLLFVSEESARDNVLREGARGACVHLVGNVTIDGLADALPAMATRRAWRSLGFHAGSYGVVSLREPSNVDRIEVLEPLVADLEALAADLPLVVPVHPRTRARLKEMGLSERSPLRLIDPPGYLEFISLLSASRIVLADSDDLQEETTYLRVPCLTLRDNTERPITVSHGTNRLVGSRPEDLRGAVTQALGRKWTHLPSPPFWDGAAAQRITAVLADAVGIGDPGLGIGEGQVIGHQVAGAR